MNVNMVLVLMCRWQWKPVAEPHVTPPVSAMFTSLILHLYCIYRDVPIPTLVSETGPMRIQAGFDE